MTETVITIKELEINKETAIRIAQCLRNHEPEIWEALKLEMLEALKLVDFSKQQKNNPYLYCQSQIEDNGKCNNQCDHCKEYYMNLK